MRMVLFLLFTAVSIGCTAVDNLRGSPETRAYENAAADFFGLDRLENESVLRSAISEGSFSCLPNNRYVRWHKRLPGAYAYCLPHVNQWLLSLGKDFRKEFGKPLTISSAIRPKSYQEKLGLRNANAAPTEGPFASTHSTGATIDIGYKGLKGKEVTWLEKTLSAMESRGEIQATKERYQACFHVMIYPSATKLAEAKKNNTTP